MNRDWYTGHVRMAPRGNYTSRVSAEHVAAALRWARKVDES
jgi:hypothetical protein